MLVHPPEHAATYYQGYPILPLHDELLGEVEVKLEANMVGGPIAVGKHARAERSKKCSFREEGSVRLAMKHFAPDSRLVQSRAP